MMVAIVIATASSLEGTRNSLVMGLPVFLGAITLNATRLNWLGTSSAVLVLLVLSLRRSQLIRLGARLAVVGAVVAAVFWILLQTDVIAPIGGLATSMLDPATNSSLVYRLLGWQHDVLPAIGVAPWTGYGTGMAKDGLGPFTSHNVVLKILLEGGALLLAVFIVTLLAIVTALLRRRSQVAARVGLALIVGVLVAGMFGPILDTYPGNLYFWLLIGCAIGSELPDGSTAPATSPGRSIEG